jgi:hypothetical protein
VTIFPLSLCLSPFLFCCDKIIMFLSVTMTSTPTQT